MVTAVEAGPGAKLRSGRHLCSVTGPEGPLNTRIWRGCGRTTRVGDAVQWCTTPKAMFHPVAWTPRGSARDGAVSPALAHALITGGAVAVVRSFRMGPVGNDRAPAPSCRRWRTRRAQWVPDLLTLTTAKG